MAAAELEKIYIENISLVNYRNFKDYALEFGKDINIIYGRNGIGKTNILEAISLFAPGNGFRKAKLGEFKNQFVNDNSVNGWFIKLNLTSSTGLSNKLITSKEDINKRRSILLNSDNNLSQAQIVKYLNVIWLTPQIDICLMKTKNADENLLIV